MTSLAGAKETEKKLGYHERCAKRFFDTPQLPIVDLDDRILETLARKSAQDGITVAGVQKKLSLHLLSEDKQDAPRLTLLGYPQGYILKPQSGDFPFLPENEHIVMTMADHAKIRTVPHSLIPLKNGSLAYITRRIDRASDRKIHMEDFCQLSERLTEDKYKGSYESCTKIIRRFSSRAGLDASEFFYRLVFCFITGNSDMHLKNFSLLKGDAGYVLSPAYDLLSVALALPSDKEETALTLNAKKTRLREKDFLAFAQTAASPQHAAKKMISRLAGMQEEFCRIARSPFLPVEMQEKLTALIRERCARLLG